MLIQACLNGSRPPGEHPALPLSAAQLAAAAAQVVAAGAGALHVHPRDDAGQQSLVAIWCDAAVRAIRAACPNTPLGLTTGAFVEPDPVQRLALVRGWSARPDYVSVNFDEPGTAELCQLLIAQGIAIEAGLSNPAGATLLLRLGLANRCVRILLEPDEDDPTAALHTSQQITAILDAAGPHAPLLLHGRDATTWPLLRYAIAHSYDTRIGLEDTLHLPNGEPAKDNAQLVAIAVKMRDA